MRLVLTALLLMLATGGCTIYKIDTQQGNVVMQDAVSQLRPGMTRSQVRFLLGSPLIADPFHADRWDYYYYFRKGGAPQAEKRRITLFFSGDVLARVEGDIAPASATPPAADAPRPAPPVAEQPAPAGPSRLL